MKKGDYGYERLLRFFKSFYCRHDADGAQPLINGCPYRIRDLDKMNHPACPHQPGWACSQVNNPGNIDFANYVMDNL